MFSNRLILPHDFTIHVSFFKTDLKYYLESLEHMLNLGSWSTARNSFAQKICSTRFYYYSTAFEQTIK
jgi:hypothetical protein